MQVVARIMQGNIDSLVQFRLDALVQTAVRLLGTVNGKAIADNHAGATLEHTVVDVLFIIDRFAGFSLTAIL